MSARSVGSDADAGGDDQKEKLAQSEEARMEALELIEQARQHQASGDTDGAEETMNSAWSTLEESLRICPQNHRARFLLVSCAMNSDDYSRARREGMVIYEDLSKRQLRKMNDAVLHLSLAHASKMLGEVDDAVRFALEASQLYTDDPNPPMVLGEIYEALGKYAEAAEMCQQALRQNDSVLCKHPLNDQSIYFTLCCLGVALVKLERYGEAEQHLQRAIDIDEQTTLALHHLVDAYYFQNRKKEALHVAQKIVALDPEDDGIQRKMDIIAQSPPASDEEDGQGDSPRSSQRSSERSRPGVPTIRMASDAQPRKSALRKPDPQRRDTTGETSESAGEESGWSGVSRAERLRDGGKASNASARLGTLAEDRSATASNASDPGKFMPKASPAGAADKLWRDDDRWGRGSARSGSELEAPQRSCHSDAPVGHPFMPRAPPAGGADKLWRDDDRWGKGRDTARSGRSELDPVGTHRSCPSARRRPPKADASNDWFFCCFDRDVKSGR